MKLPSRFSLTLFCILLLLASTTASAHRIRVFAYENGGLIHVEAVFNGGKPVKNSKVHVQNGENNTLLLTTTTDDNGKVSFPIPEEAKNKKYPLNIIVDMGEGHRSQWLLQPEDYLSMGDQALTTKKSTSQGANTASPTLPVQEEQLQRIINRALDEKLAPIKRMMAQDRNKGPTLQDILGGIGYIFGLTGIAAYVSARKKREQTAPNGEDTRNNG